MEIIKKEVKFNGSKILTVKENEKIYVGVAYICYSLGMSEDQKRRQIKKVREDETETINFAVSLRTVENKKEKILELIRKDR